MSVVHTVVAAVADTVIDGEPPSPPGATIAQAALALGVSREAIRQRLRRGTLPATKVNGQWFIHLDQLNRPGTAEPTPEPTPTGDARPTNPPDGSGDGVAYARLVDHLEKEIGFLREELQRKDELLRSEQDTRRREVSELHILLQRAQAQLPIPAIAPHHDTTPAHEPRRRHWWWPWG